MKNIRNFCIIAHIDQEYACGQVDRTYPDSWSEGDGEPGPG